MAKQCPLTNIVCSAEEHPRVHSVYMHANCLMDLLMGRRGKMTEEKLIQIIRSGYGQGHGDAYRPFLKNTRAAISKQGTQSSAKVLYGFNRSCDFKSRQEKNIARALLWLGASDIREQFPIWPWPHHHPLLGTPGAEKLVLAPAPGLIEIAEEANIFHGVYIGTNLPYVATIDFMVTVYTNKIPRLVAIACKDREVVLDVEGSFRPRERLELERRYCARLYIPHLIVDREVFGNTLLANLAWLMPDEQVVADLTKDQQIGSFFSLINKEIFKIAIDEAVDQAGATVGWTPKRALSAFRYFAWTPTFDIDLTKPVLMTQPATPGGARIHQLLQKRILGEIDDG